MKTFAPGLRKSGAVVKRMEINIGRASQQKQHKTLQIFVMTKKQAIAFAIAFYFSNFSLR